MIRSISCPKCNHSIKRRAVTRYILCASCKHCFKDLQVIKGEEQTASETPKPETALPDTQKDEVIV